MLNKFTLATYAIGINYDDLLSCLDIKADSSDLLMKQYHENLQRVSLLLEEALSEINKLSIPSQFKEYDVKRSFEVRFDDDDMAVIKVILTFEE